MVSLVKKTNPTGRPRKTRLSEPPNQQQRKCQSYLVDSPNNEPLLFLNVSKPVLRLQTNQSIEQGEYVCYCDTHRNY